LEKLKSPRFSKGGESAVKMRRLTHLLLLFGLILNLGIMPEAIVAQREGAKSLTRSDVILDSSRPSIFSCFDEVTPNLDRSSSIWVRITNNSIWTLQFPAHERGSSHTVQKLSDGREVAMLLKGAIFHPGYGLISDSGRQVITQISIHLGTVSFLPSNSYAIFSVQRRKSKKGRLYLDFNYEWELNTVYQATPTHRLYIELNEKRREQNLCANVDKR
jgi:hypothetical protein